VPGPARPLALGRPASPVAAGAASDAEFDFGLDDTEAATEAAAEATGGSGSQYSAAQYGYEDEGRGLDDSRSLHEAEAGPELDLAEWVDASGRASLGTWLRWLGLEAEAARASGMLKYAVRGSESALKDYYRYDAAAGAYVDTRTGRASLTHPKLRLYAAKVQVALMRRLRGSPRARGGDDSASEDDTVSASTASPRAVAGTRDGTTDSTSPPRTTPARPAPAPARITIPALPALTGDDDWLLDEPPQRTLAQPAALAPAHAPRAAPAARPAPAPAPVSVPVPASATVSTTVAAGGGFSTAVDDSAVLDEQEHQQHYQQHQTQPHRSHRRYQPQHPASPASPASPVGGADGADYAAERAFLKEQVRIHTPTLTHTHTTVPSPPPPTQLRIAQADLAHLSSTLASQLGDLHAALGAQRRQHRQQAALQAARHDAELARVRAAAERAARAESRSLATQQEQALVRPRIHHAHTHTCTCSPRPTHHRLPRSPSSARWRHPRQD
jgi:hypothetical protein